MALHKGGPMPLAITAAFGQSTPAMQAKISGARGGRKSARLRSASRSVSRKPRRQSIAAAKKKRSTGSSKRGAKRALLKKGSAAAKKWGKKMAALRKRRR